VLQPLQRSGKINYAASRDAKWDASTREPKTDTTTTSPSPTLITPVEKWQLSASAANGHVSVKMLSWIESVIGTVPGGFAGRK
jgi:hypothetical protein